VPNVTLLPIVTILMLIDRPALGGARERVLAELDCAGHRHHRDQDDAGDAVGDNSGALIDVRSEEPL
jgi:ABC-type microcin C transport system permease subunit YejB